MNWNEAHTIMETAGWRKRWRGQWIDYNTWLYERHDDNYEIRLHGNVIMIISKDCVIPLDDGGETVEALVVLNRYLPRGFYVHQNYFDGWAWYLKDSNNDIDYNFGDVYWIHNDGRVMLYSTHPHYPNQKNVENLPFLNWNNLPWRGIK